jgi:hypothetical protein
VLFGFSCSKKQYKSFSTNNDSIGISDSTYQRNQSSLEVSPSKSEMTRFSLKYESYLTEGLKELSDSNIFSIRHAHSISRLDSIHQIYFAEKLEYDLLFYSNGDLFQNGRDDYAFIIYDKLNHLISISFYNDLTKDYSLLYQDLRVENGIKPDDCDYYTTERLDYQIASELVWLKESLIKNPESLSEYSICKIGDITENQDIVIKHGCISENYNLSDSISSLCLATSLIYNNWECMRYEKERNVLIIFYGQAFAD